MKQAHNLAIVSGATGGIGRAAVQALLGSGHDILALGRSQVSIERLLGTLRHDGPPIRTAICDVTSAADVATVADLARGAARGSVVLVNNAGTLGPIGSFGVCDIDAWCEAVDVNLSGAARLTHALIDVLSDRPGSSVVNISTGASANPMNGWSAYCASKAGLAMLTRMLHLEYGDRFLTFGFQPGLVDTDMQGRIRATRTNAIGDIPQSDLLPPEDPAAIIAWLAAECPADLAGTEFRADDPDIRKRAALAG